MPRLKAPAFLLSLATACAPATLLAQAVHGAVPGSIQFTQGQANIDGQPIAATNSNTQPRQLHAGETIATANGTADILLAPGALLRIGQDSTVRMVADDATHTEVRLQQGIANVSANVVRKNDLVLIDTQNGQTQLLSRGLYSFNAGTNTVRVFNGEAYVFPGADTTSNVKPVKLKEGHELILGGDRAKPADFDRETADTDLLPWTGPVESRAALADATVQHGGGATYASYGYGGGYGYGGYGYPGYGFYGGGYGYPYYAYAGDPYLWGPYGFYGYPFFGVGFGFYGGGLYGGGYGRGYGGAPIKGPGRLGYVGGGRGAYAGHAFAGGGGFHGGGFGGGGFHGGGGGFHGGGGGHR